MFTQVEIDRLVNQKPRRFMILTAQESKTKDENKKYTG
jgi:hypothetical protein